MIMSKMTDYIIEICNFLEKNGIDTSDYNDDLSYYNGFDDVLVVYLKDERYKFYQTYKDECYKNFTLNVSTGEIVEGYDNVVQYLTEKFKIVV